MEKKYYKIGETFEFEWKELEVIKSKSCDGCFFDNARDFCSAYSCYPHERQDEISVNFKEIGIAQPFLNKLANQASFTALSRGKNMDNFLEDLQSEIAEFENSKLAENVNVLEPLLRLSNNIEDDYFVKVYEKNFKNTSQDELMDIIITCMSKAQDMGIDIDTWIKAKMKYNSLRRD